MIRSNFDAYHIELFRLVLILCHFCFSLDYSYSFFVILFNGFYVQWVFWYVNGRQFLWWKRWHDRPRISCMFSQPGASQRKFISKAKSSWFICPKKCKRCLTKIKAHNTTRKASFRRNTKYLSQYPSMICNIKYPQ